MRRACCMTVAADDGHPGLRAAQFRLMTCTCRAAHRACRTAPPEFGGIALELPDLFRGRVHLMESCEHCRSRRRRMIHGRQVRSGRRTRRSSDFRTLNACGEVTS